MTSNYAYVNPLTGQTVNPSQIGYESLTISSNTALEWPVNGNFAQNVVAGFIQVIATQSGLSLLLPSALQVSTGQSVLIQNIGSTIFTVTDISGNTIATIDSGVAEQIFLTDNSTNNGAWTAFVLGAGTSSANSAQLAGYGLIASNLTLNQQYPESAIYSSVTIDATYRSKFLVWSSGVGTITLPSSAIVGNGWFVMIRNSGSGILTLATTGSDTIDGNTFAQLQLTESLVVVSNGSGGYSTFAYGRSSTFSYTQLAKTVTGGTATLTAAEYANVVQEYYGTLTSNQTIILPSTVQIYYLNNLTTGSYSLVFSTSALGGATVSVPQNSTVTVICDGTNVYSSSSAIVGSISSVSVSNGSAAAPSIAFTGDSSTGIFQSASGQVSIASEGVVVATFSSAGLTVPLGIAGGTF